MMQMLADALAALDAFLVGAVSSPWMLPVLFGACLLDGVFPPAPGELVLIAAATLVWTTDPAAILLVLAVASLGAWAGDNCAYLLGRRLGRVPRRAGAQGGAAAVALRLRAQMHRRPESILVAGRFLPGVRMVLNMAAGMVSLEHRRFALASLAATAVWAGVQTAMAVAVGTLLTADPLLAAVTAAATAMLVGVGVDRAVAWWRRRAGHGGEGGAP